MSDRAVKVNPQVLQSAGTSFGQVGDGLANMQADAPLGDAAGAVGQLQTAEACRRAQAGVAAATTAAIERIRKFGGNLNTAARLYQQRDQAAAEAIGSVEVPK